MSKASGSIDLKSLKVAGEGASKYITEIGSGGISVHDASNNSNYVAITSSGMEVYAGTSSSNKVAEFKSYINIGTSNNNNSKAGTAVIGTGLEISSQLATTSQTIVGKYNLQDIYAQFLVGIGTSASNRINAFGVSSTYGQQVLEIFEGNGSTTVMPTSFNIDTTKSITAYQVDDSSVTYTATASSSNTKQINFNTAPTADTQVCVYYTTADNNGYIYTSKNNITGRGAYSFSQGEGEALGYATHAFGETNTTTGFIRASGSGSLAHGKVSDNSTMTASGSGSSVQGYVDSGTITASGIGSSIQVYVDSGTITAKGIGSSVQGYADNSTITARGNGSSIQGCAIANSTMTTNSIGSFIQGYAFHSITAVSGIGSSIQGYANYGTMAARGNGSSIQGYTYYGTMTADGNGSIALNESTHALKRAQLAIGSYNADDPASSTSTTHPSGTAAYGTYAFIIGNGSGESSRSNAFAVDWQGNIYPNNEKMDNFIVEQSTSGIWTYRKWSDGTAECWGKGTKTLSHYTTVSGLYGYYTSFSLPSGLFTSVDTHTYTATVGNGFSMPASGMGTSTSLITVYALATTSGSQSCTFDMLVIGKWK